MLLFGHTGIITGVVKACEILGSVSRPSHIRQPVPSSRFGTTIHKKRLRLYRLLSGIKNLMGPIDYRLVLIGSLLPDILDKPLWFFTGGDIFVSGRSYIHTLLFNLVLFICGLILVKYGKSWLLIISLGSFMHLILDRIWGDPVVLWWPLLGPFQRVETAGWIANTLHGLVSDPKVYIPEIIGLIIILLLGYRLMVKKNAIKFIRTGAID